MAATTNWKPAYKASVVHNGVTLYATSASVSGDIDQFDATNTVSNGSYEFGVSVSTYRISVSLVVDDDTPAIPNEKDLVTCSYGDGANTYSGKGRVVRVNRRGGGRGGYTVDLEIAFTGPVTKS